LSHDFTVGLVPECEECVRVVCDATLTDRPAETLVNAPVPTAAEVPAVAAPNVARNFRRFVFDYRSEVSPAESNHRVAPAEDAVEFLQLLCPCATPAERTSSDYFVSS
jgi:hypothetical protein